MRRLVHSRKGRKGRHIFILLFTVVTLAVYGAIELDARIQPVLQEFAEYETRSATVRVMNAAVLKEMAANPARYEALYVIRYTESGELLSVQSDPGAVNLARGYLIQAVSDALDAVPEQNIRIPLGSLLDSAILNNLGPDWTLTIQPRGYADGELHETVRPLAINRAEYRIDLTLKTAVNMILEGRAHVLWVETEVPLAHILLDGSVPAYYDAG